jgi:hypothetical protein
MNSRRKHGADPLKTSVPVLSSAGPTSVQDPPAANEGPSERAFVQATSRLSAPFSSAAMEGGPRPGGHPRSPRNQGVSAEAANPGAPVTPSREPVAPLTPPTPSTAVPQQSDEAGQEATRSTGRRPRRRGAGGQQANSQSSAPSAPVAPVPSVASAPPLEQVKAKADKVSREVDDVRGEARELRQEVGDLSDLSVRVEALQNEVREAEERLQHFSERREIERVAEDLRDVTGQAATLHQQVGETEKVLERLRQQVEQTSAQAREQAANLADLRQQTVLQTNASAGQALRLRDSFQELEMALLTRCQPLEERLTRLDAGAAEGWRLLQSLREEIETTGLQVQVQREELRAGAAILQELRGQIQEAEELLEVVRREYWAAKDLPRPMISAPQPEAPVVVQIEEVAPVLEAAADSTVATDGKTLGVTVDPEGQVVEVAPGSPAERAGVAVNDRIIAVNGEPVTDGESLREVVQRSEVGSELALRLQRGETTTEVMARIEPQPAAGTAP